MHTTAFQIFTNQYHVCSVFPRTITVISVPHTTHCCRPSVCISLYLSVQSWKLICRLLKLFRNFAPPPPYNVELWPGNQRCEQHCAGGGGGGPIAFHRGCLHRIIVQRLYQIVRHDRFYKSLQILFP